MRIFGVLTLLVVVAWSAPAVAQEAKDGKAQVKKKAPPVPKEIEADWKYLNSQAVKVQRASKKYAQRIEVETSVDEVVRKIGKSSPPSKAWKWVRDNIGYEPYGGLLRGARGALLARKANAVDQAALLSEIYVAQGHSVRFVSGDIYAKDAQTLLAEINGSATLISPQAAVGKDFTKTSYVAADQLRYQQPVTQHVWVEVKYKGQWMTADPVFATRFGATLGKGTDVREKLLDELGGTIRIRVRARLKDDQDKELVSVFGRIDKFSYQNIALEFEQSPMLKGQLQPVLSVAGQSKKGEVFPVKELDWLRVEFAVRRGRIEDRFAETLYKDGEPNSIFDYDQTYWGIALLPGWVPPDFLRITTARYVGASSQALADFTKNAAGGGTTANFDMALNETHRPYAFLISSMYATHLDRLTRELAYSMGVTPILHEPRVIMTGILRKDDSYDYRISARGNALEAMPKLGVPAAAASGFLSVHGRMAHQLEAELLHNLSGSKVISVDRLFVHAAKTKKRVTTIHQKNLSKARRLGLSKEVRGALENQVRNRGAVVLTPSGPVDLDGGKRAGWWALNPTTGNVEGSLGERMLSTIARKTGRTMQTRW